MKKILIIQETLGGGGAERVLKNILDNLDYSKFKVDLLLIYNEGVYLEKINPNVNIKYIYKKLKYKNKILNKINFSIRKFIFKYFSKLLYKKYVIDSYDVEIAFLEGDCTRILSSSTNKISQKIAWIHIDLSKYRRMSKSEEASCYSKFNKVICVSEDSKNSFIKLYPQFKDKAEVIYNLINIDEINDLSKEKIDYRFSYPTLIGVGRLVEQKRFDILIRAHKILIDEGIDNKLIILGEGPKHLELMNLIKELNLENSVDIIGFKSNPYPYIKNSTVFVMSSDFEGFSLVVAEAIVLGKAIVSTRCVGPCELLKNGENGILVECGDIYGLKEGIKNIILNEEYKRCLENKSLEQSKIFNKDLIMKRIEKILEKNYYKK